MQIRKYILLSATITALFFVAGSTSRAQTPTPAPTDFLGSQGNSEDRLLSGIVGGLVGGIAGGLGGYLSATAIERRRYRYQAIGLISAVLYEIISNAIRADRLERKLRDGTARLVWDEMGQFTDSVWGRVDTQIGQFVPFPTILRLHEYYRRAFILNQALADGADALDRPWALKVLQECVSFGNQAGEELASLPLARGMTEQFVGARIAPGDGVEHRDIDS